MYGSASGNYVCPWPRPSSYIAIHVEVGPLSYLIADYDWDQSKIERAVALPWGKIMGRARKGPGSWKLAVSGSRFLSQSNQAKTGHCLFPIFVSSDFHAAGLSNGKHRTCHTTVKFLHAAATTPR
jgi:hypothetical protein